jgi:hypothetical protein
MSLTTEELIRIDGFILAAGGDARKACFLAFEDGKLSGALQAAQRLGQESMNKQASGGDGEDDGADDGPLSESDKRALSSLGLDVNKTYIHKNSRLKISGYKPSRWKYPISVQNQNGRKLKCSATFLKGCRIV